MMLKTSFFAVLAFIIFAPAMSAHACFRPPPSAHLKVVYLSPACAYVRPYSSYQEQGLKLYNSCEKNIRIHSLSTYQSEEDIPKLVQNVNASIHPTPNEKRKNFGCLVNADTLEKPCHGIELPPHSALQLSNFGENVHIRLANAEPDVLDKRPDLFQGYLTVTQPEPCPLFSP